MYNIDSIGPPPIAIRNNQKKIKIAKIGIRIDASRYMSTRDNPMFTPTAAAPRSGSTAKAQIQHLTFEHPLSKYSLNSSLLESNLGHLHSVSNLMLLLERKSTVDP